VTTDTIDTKPADEKAWLTEQEAASRVRLSPQMLRKLRYAGGGPAYGQFGRAVRYRLDLLDEWANSQLRRSTADATVQGARR
jgi:hypothetical protein